MLTSWRWVFTPKHPRGPSIQIDQFLKLLVYYLVSSKKNDLSIEINKSKSTRVLRSVAVSKSSPHDLLELEQPTEATEWVHSLLPIQVSKANHVDLSGQVQNLYKYRSDTWVPSCFARLSPSPMARPSACRGLEQPAATILLPGSFSM